MVEHAGRGVNEQLGHEIASIFQHHPTPRNLSPFLSSFTIPAPPPITFFLSRRRIALRRLHTDRRQRRPGNGAEPGR